MKFDKDTLEVLKNFSQINPSIIFKPGSILKTINEKGSIIAKATVNVDIPIEFGIYNLSEFLGLVALFKDPDFKFTDKYVEITDGSSKCRYTQTEIFLITPAPELVKLLENQIKLPTKEFSGKVTKEMFKKVLVAANQLSLPDIGFRSDRGKAYIVATDTKNPTCNEYVIDLGQDTANDFQYIIKAERLKLLPGDYDVEISAKGISRFASPVVEYWIALDKETKTNKR